MLSVVGLLDSVAANLSGDLAAHNGGLAGTLGCAERALQQRGALPGMFTGKLTVNHSTLGRSSGTSSAIW